MKTMSTLMATTPTMDECSRAETAFGPEFASCERILSHPIDIAAGSNDHTSTMIVLQQKRLS